MYSFPEVQWKKNSKLSAGFFLNNLLPKSSSQVYGIRSCWKEFFIELRFQFQVKLPTRVVLNFDFTSELQVTLPGYIIVKNTCYGRKNS